MSKPFTVIGNEIFIELKGNTVIKEKLHRRDHRDNKSTFRKKESDAVVGPT